MPKIITPMVVKGLNLEKYNKTILYGLRQIYFDRHIYWA